jgi:GNAT superfamily N-acetyltransferase
LTSTIRPASGAGERSLIIESTCHARQPQCHGRHVIPWNAWLAMYAPAVQHAMATGHSLVADMDGVAVGFLVAQGGRVFMLYVKQEFRGVGFGRELLESALAQGLLHTPLETTADMVTPSWRAWTSGIGLSYRVAA